MSKSNIEANWLRFVRSLRSVGALLIFIIIPYIAFVIIPIQFILTIVAISDIREMNRKLNNSFLNNFQSRYLTASIFKFIGSILVHVGGAMLAMLLAIGPIFDPLDILPFRIWLAPATTIFFVFGFLSMIIGSMIEVGAWDNLKTFIQDNTDLFPERMRSEIRISIDNIRSGALMWALGFLIVPIIIGWIFQLIGYFSLSNVARYGMTVEPITPISEKTPLISPVAEESHPVSTPVQESPPEDVIKFCPMCGAKVQEAAKFCGECGVKIGS